MTDYIRPPIPDRDIQYCRYCDDFFEEIFCPCQQTKRPKYWLDEVIKTIDFPETKNPTDKDR